MLGLLSNNIMSSVFLWWGVESGEWRVGTCLLYDVKFDSILLVLSMYVVNGLSGYCVVGG